MAPKAFLPVNSPVRPGYIDKYHFIERQKHFITVEDIGNSIKRKCYCVSLKNNCTLSKNIIHQLKYPNDQNVITKMVSKPLDDPT